MLKKTPVNVSYKVNAAALVSQNRSAGIFEKTGRINLTRNFLTRNGSYLHLYYAVLLVSWSTPSSTVLRCFSRPRVEFDLSRSDKS